MSNLKSKLPSLNEIAAMATKFCKDVSHSVSTIIKEYKETHSHCETKCSSHAHKKSDKAHEPKRHEPKKEEEKHEDH